MLERYFRQKMVESMGYRAIGNWWVPKNKEDQCEIDILALTADGQTLEAYEVKRNKANYKEALLQKKQDHFLTKKQRVQEICD